MRKQLVAANNRRSKRSLHFIFYSVDEVNDFEIVPVASFEPTLQERRRLYILYQPNEVIWQRGESLGDRASGAGPATLSLIRNVDLAEVPGSFANAQPSLPTFDATAFEFAVAGHSILSSRDRWALQLIGARFRCLDIIKKRSWKMTPTSKTDIHQTYLLFIPLLRIMQ